LLPLHVQNANGETTRLQKTSEQRRISWSSLSIAAFAKSIRRTRRRSNGIAGDGTLLSQVAVVSCRMELTIIQASSSNGRAPDSKSGCWGFESLLACQTDFILKDQREMGEDS
jgi:hypothetical protein